MKTKEIVYYSLFFISNLGIGLAIISTVFELNSMDSTKTCHTEFFDHIYSCTGNGMDEGNLQFGIIALSIFLILIDIGFTIVYFQDMKKLGEQQNYTGVKQ